MSTEEVFDDLCDYYDGESEDLGIMRVCDTEEMKILKSDGEDRITFNIAGQPDVEIENPVCEFDEGEDTVSVRCGPEFAPDWDWKDVRDKSEL